MMRIKDIYSTKPKYLNIADLENMFDIYVDVNGNFAFNLNNTLYIKVPVSRIKRYVCTSPSNWNLISYLLYGSTRFSWILQKLNHVSAKNMFKTLQPGDTIYCLSNDDVASIVQSVNA